MKAKSYTKLIFLLTTTLTYFFSVSLGQEINKPIKVIKKLKCAATYYEQSSSDSDERIDLGNEDDQNSDYKIDFLKSNDYKKYSAEEREYEAEKKAGDRADLSGANPHRSYPKLYKDFGRRFILQYPYTEKQLKNSEKEESANRELIPMKASPETVLAIAMQSALDEASKPLNRTDDSNRKDILRTGEFWNAVWVEEADPAKMLRSQRYEKLQNNVKGLGSVKAKLMPGSQLYQLVSVLKQFSPRLLYVLNNKD